VVPPTAWSRRAARLRNLSPKRGEPRSEPQRRADNQPGCSHGRTPGSPRGVLGGGLAHPSSSCLHSRLTSLKRRAGCVTPVLGFHSHPCDRNRPEKIGGEAGIRILKTAWRMAWTSGENPLESASVLAMFWQRSQQPPPHRVAEREHRERRARWRRRRLLGVGLLRSALCPRQEWRGTDRRRTLDCGDCR